MGSRRSDLSPSSSVAVAGRQIFGMLGLRALFPLFFSSSSSGIACSACVSPGRLTQHDVIAVDSSLFFLPPLFFFFFPPPREGRGLTLQLKGEEI